jgi:DNA-binding transcriptional ArsR family regulator
MDAPAPRTIDAYVFETLLPDLVGHDRRASAFLVYLVILTADGGARVALSYAQLAERTGLSRRAVQSAIAVLRRRQLIETTRRAATDTSQYRALSPWRRGQSMQTEETP